MKKKFFYGFIALLAVTALFMVGCKQPTDEEPPQDVAVTSVSISIQGAGVVTDTTQYLYIGQNATLVGNVLPADATNKGVTWGSSDSNVATVSATGVVHGVGAGEAVITVTSAGAKADGTFATAIVTFNVSLNPNDIVAELLLVNQAASPGAGTTTVLPALDANSRLVISNDEADAQVPGVAANVAGNTIVYLNIPLAFDSEEEEGFSISARVKITGVSDKVTSSYNDTGHGIITGVFTDPTVPVSADTPLYFVGVRSAAGGQKRMYATRNSAPPDNSSTTINGPANTFEAHDKTEDDGFNFIKTDGFVDQEYIFKVAKTAADTYNLFVLTPDGVTELATGTRSADNQVSPPLKNPDTPVPLYVGFIVTGVTVEISDIEIIEKGEEVFALAKDAVPATVAVKEIRVTTANPVGADADYDYQSTLAAFPSAGVLLTSQVYPAGAATVTWSIAEGDTLATVNNGLVTITGAGAVTVRATAGGENVDFKFNIVVGVTPASSVAVSGPTTVTAGRGISDTGGSITLTSQVTPSLAPQEVTWSVTADDGTSVTAAATINNSTGVLTAAGGLTADTKVHVFATSSNGVDGASVKSPAYEVTIEKWDPTIWEWKTGDTAPANAFAIINGVGAMRTGGTITGTTDGLSMSNSRWVLGYNSGTASATSTSAYVIDATLDLSQKFKVTVDYSGATGSGNFAVTLNNNQGNNTASVFGGSTPIGKSGCLINQNLSGTGTIAVTVDPATDLTLTTQATDAGVVKADVLQHSFLQFRAESSLTAITVTHILVEYVD